jgi:DNA (cytosine-5)-methyltransferase 1
MLAPRTAGSESGYWLTCPTPTVKGNYNKAGLSDKSGDGLATWAAQFPTPTSTPYGTRNNGHRPDGSTYRTAGSPSLDTMARHALWPTPTAQDAANNGAPSQMERNTPPLNAAVGGALSPTWVEWLMGWPLGWTACDASATGRYLPARRRRGGNS